MRKLSRTFALKHLIALLTVAAVFLAVAKWRKQSQAEIDHASNSLIDDGIFAGPLGKGCWVLSVPNHLPEGPLTAEQLTHISRLRFDVIEIWPGGVFATSDTLAIVPRHGFDKLDIMDTALTEEAVDALILRTLKFKRYESFANDSAPMMKLLSGVEGLVSVNLEHELCRTIEISKGFDDLQQLSIGISPHERTEQNQLVSIANLNRLETVTIELGGSERGAVELTSIPNLATLNITHGTNSPLTVKLNECRAIETLTLENVAWSQELWTFIESLEALRYLEISCMEEDDSVTANLPSEHTTLKMYSCVISKQTMNRFRSQARAVRTESCWDLEFVPLD